MRLRKRRRERDDGGGGQENPKVRQYRYLLRTAPVDALEAAHADGLSRLTSPQRDAVLLVVQQALLVGNRLRSDDVSAVGHLITSGERRNPRSFIRACESTLLQDLAHGVITSEAVSGLCGGYGDWDGADPQPEPEGAWAEGGFNPDSGRWNPDRHTPRDQSGIVGGIGGVPADGGAG